MRNVNFFSRLGVGLIALASCSTAALAHGVKDSPAFTNISAEGKALSNQFLREGISAPLSRIQSVRVGQQQSEVRQLIGQPATQSNLNNTPAWEYHFAIPFVQRGDALVCQFMVEFNANTHQVSDTYWRRHQCKDLAAQATDFSAEVLFDFGRDSLSAAGKVAIDKLLQNLPTPNTPTSVVVVGHADRIGSAAYNQQLSERRASAVANYLAEKGVPRSAVRAYGRGETQPVVTCNDTNLAALKECLAPNRRIDLQIQ